MDVLRNKGFVRFYVYQDLSLQWDHQTLPTLLATTLRTLPDPLQDFFLNLQTQGSHLANIQLVITQLWCRMHIQGRCLMELQDFILILWLQVDIQLSLLQVFTHVHTHTLQNGVTTTATTMATIRATTMVTTKATTTATTTVIIMEG